MPRLVALETARKWLGAAEGDDTLDAVLEIALEGAEALVEAACARDLGSFDGVERLDGTGTAALYLKHYPIREVHGVSFANAGQGVRLSEMRSWGQLAASSTPPELDDLDTDTAGGLHRLDGGLWPLGSRNVRVEYEGGYTPDTLPADLRLLILQVTAASFRGRGSEGVKSESLGDLSRTYAQPTEADVLAIPGAAAIIARYRRIAA